MLNVDCCAAFLGYARRCRGRRHRERDARFGTQFFDNPVAGLRNIQSAFRPGSMLTMIVWRALEENPA